MRVKAGQHAADRVVDQCLVGDILDIIALDGGKHLGEGA